MKPKTVGRGTGGFPRPGDAQELCHGFPVGLPIDTTEGPKAAETLSPCDLIITRNGGAIPPVSVTAVTRSTRAVLFAAGSIALQDVVLPFDQPVLVRDAQAQAMFGQAQAMVLAGHLVDGDRITDIGPRRLVLFRLEFSRPRIVTAAGLELGCDPISAPPIRAVA